jgi:hypothetical protein
MHAQSPHEYDKGNNKKMNDIEWPVPLVENIQEKA